MLVMTEDGGGFVCAYSANDSHDVGEGVGVVGGAGGDDEVWSKAGVETWYSDAEQRILDTNFTKGLNENMLKEHFLSPDSSK